MTLMTQKNRHALVTGASEGIGRVFAKRLASEGYSLTLVARNRARLEELKSELDQEFTERNHDVIVADLSTDTGVALVTQAITTRHHDLLINNAGYGLYGEFAETPIEQLQLMTRLNCDALTVLSHHYLKTARKGDALMNVGSVYSFLPAPYNAVYGATKAYVLSLSEALWYEQSKHGVFVMALCPGYTLTTFSARAGRADNPAYARLAQTPEQVVETALAHLKRRSSPAIVSGLSNSALKHFQKLLPSSLRARLSGAMLERFLELKQKSS